MLSTQELINAAMDATGLSARSLARLLAVGERTVRRYREGTLELRGPTRQLCRALVWDPSIALALGDEE